MQRVLMTIVPSALCAGELDVIKKFVDPEIYFRFFGKSYGFRQHQRGKSEGVTRCGYIRMAALFLF